LSTVAWEVQLLMTWLVTKVRSRETSKAKIRSRTSHSTPRGSRRRLARERDKTLLSGVSRVPLDLALHRSYQLLGALAYAEHRPGQKHGKLAVLHF